MKEYQVHMPIAGTYCIEIEAKSEEEAIEKAYEKLDAMSRSVTPELENWEPYTEMMQGYYCLVSDNEAWADLVDWDEEED